jgi:hypothetical protein
MSGPSEIAETWRMVLDGAPGALRREHPVPRQLFPFPTYRTLQFCQTPQPRPTAVRLPYIVCGGPPYQVFTSGYGQVVGEADTPQEAAELLVSTLPNVRKGS